jgi:hypothetical protein
MLIILLRLKQHSGGVMNLHSELLELCGVELMDMVSLIVNNRISLSAEFQVRVQNLIDKSVVDPKLFIMDPDQNPPFQ